MLNAPSNRTLSRNRMKDKRWITSALKKRSRLKNKLYKDWINKRTSESERKYKTYKQLFKKVSHEAEALYYKELLSSESNSINIYGIILTWYAV